MVSKVGCAERLFSEDEFPVIVVQLVKLSYNMSRRDSFPALHICPIGDSDLEFYLWAEIDPRAGSEWRSSGFFRLFFLDIE